MVSTDGTWDLKILVTDLQVERMVRVHGEDHIGGVMIKLVDILDIAMDWSDHALWWPGKNQWLHKTRWTLEQYNIFADDSLEFTPMHKTLRVQLPDLRYTDARVNFSVKSFSAMVALCRELEIRHPEELSFCKGVEYDHLKYNYGTIKKEEDKTRRITVATMSPTLRPDTNTFISNSETLRRKSTNSSPMHRKQSSRSNMSIGTPRLTNKSFGSDWSLAMSPPPTDEAKETIVKPKTLVERARMNVAWLDSSLSIMEQGVAEFDTLLLRFKYYCFYDLSPKEDPVRINLIYEQARWQILNEEIDCTEEEQYLFSALQLQAGLQANVPQPKEDAEDDVEAALNELQISLDGGHVNQVDLTAVPQIAAYLKYLKPRRFTLKGFKTSYFVCRDMTLLGWKNMKEFQDYGQEPHLSIQLKGCEVIPDVNIHQGKYGIKLSVPSSDGMSDVWLRCDDETQYSQWMAACRVGSKGKTLADISYEQEVSTIKAFLSMQHPANLPAINPNTLDIDTEDYVAKRFTKKRGKNKCRGKILEAHANVKDLNLIESKMNFIKAWQSLPEYGVSLFVVKFHGERREELLGISFNRISRMNLTTGDYVTSWRYNTIKAWNVNWETGYMMIQLGAGTNIIFQCLSADCKVVHEFIGGYIFMSMRSKESNQALNSELFHKLTDGWN